MKFNTATVQLFALVHILAHSYFGWLVKRTIICLMVLKFQNNNTEKSVSRAISFLSSLLLSLLQLLIQRQLKLYFRQLWQVNELHICLLGKNQQKAILSYKRNSLHKWMFSFESRGAKVKERTKKRANEWVWAQNTTHRNQTDDECFLLKQRTAHKHNKKRKCIKCILL